MIMQYTRRNCGQVPCQLQITFGNPAVAGVRYCQAFNDRAGQCMNDGNPRIFKRGMPDRDFSAARIASVDEDLETSALFLLAGGMEVVMRKFRSFLMTALKLTVCSCQHSHQLNGHAP